MAIAIPHSVAYGLQRCPKPCHSCHMHYRRRPAALTPLADKFYRAQRSPMRTAPGAQVWVAEQAAIVAALCLQPVAHGHWLTGLLVAKPQRGQGLARQLINTAQASCHTPLWLFCHPQLSAFYQRLGFTPVDDLPQVLAERLARYQRSKPLLAFTR